MRFTTKTEYGLVCLLHMARNNSDGPVTVKGIVQGEKISPTFTEKILQRLKAAKIVSSQQGNHGGYILAKKPSEITLKHIVEALEGRTFEVFCDSKKRKEILCHHFSMCDLSFIWYQTKELLDRFYDSITLEMMALSGKKNHGR